MRTFRPSLTSGAIRWSGSLGWLMNGGSKPVPVQDDFELGLAGRPGCPGRTFLLTRKTVRQKLCRGNAPGARDRRCRVTATVAWLVGKLHRRAASLQGGGRGFQNSHQFRAARAATYRRGPGADAVEEMLALGLERLFLLDIRRIHVAVV